MDTEQQEEGEDPRYEVEKIVGRRLRTFGKAKVWQYLMRWKGWGPEDDHWKSESACGDCLELVEQYERTVLVSDNRIDVTKADLRKRQDFRPKGRSKEVKMMLIMWADVSKTKNRRSSVPLPDG